MVVALHGRRERGKDARVEKAVDAVAESESMIVDERGGEEALLDEPSVLEEWDFEGGDDRSRQEGYGQSVFR